MARSRIIKPEFWDDEKLARLSRDARLFFIGLWTNSDDYGVVKGNVVWLRNQILPYEEVAPAQVQKWLDALEKLDRIRGFQHNDERFYYIKNFCVHQKVDHPSKTRNPEPPSSILTEGSRELQSDSRDILDETEVKQKQKQKLQKRKHLASVFLSEDEFQKLIGKFGATETQRWIKKVDDYCAIHGKKYKDHYRVILNWYERDCERKMEAPQQKLIINPRNG